MPLYYGSKAIALVCDNQLYLKPTRVARQKIAAVDEAPPYPGAKLYFRITQHIDDRDWLQELVLLTAKASPDSKPKKLKVKSQKLRTSLYFF